MENVIFTILIAGGTAFVTAFVQWYFYKREHRAKANQAEASALKSEIQNYQIILDDWKKAAEDWRKSAEENRERLLEARSKVDDLEIQIITIRKELKCAQAKIRLLQKATTHE